MVINRFDRFFDQKQLSFRITGEPLFGHPPDGLIYSDETLTYSSNTHEHHPAMVAAAGGYTYRPHSTDLTGFLSAAVGHHQILQAGIDFDPDESDDDEISGPSDDEDDEDNHDGQQSDGDESSAGELDE